MTRRGRVLRSAPVAFSAMIWRRSADAFVPGDRDQGRTACRAALELRAANHAVDLIWGAHDTFEEFLAHNPAVLVTMNGGDRQIAFHRVRGQIRYEMCATRDFGPPREVGIAPSIDVVVEMCREYLWLLRSFSDIRAARQPFPRETASIKRTRR